MSARAVPRRKQRQITKALVTERPRSAYGFCAYCGHPCAGYTCTAHSDLPSRESEHVDHLRSVSTTDDRVTTTKEPSSTAHQDAPLGSQQDGG